MTRHTAWEPWLGAVVDWLEPPLGGGEGPLAGTTLGVKDLIAVAGQPRRCAAPDLVDTTPQPEHATVVARLLDAGAQVVATTQLHQLAYGIISPQTRNPRAPDRVAGGSSGGSGAAVAAGLMDAALGTDTGGSVRIPAAGCGVVGLKPTRGLVPLTGVQPLAWSLDTVGALAGSVDDVSRVMDVLAGEDPADPYSVAAPPDASAAEHAAPTAPAERLRLGVPRQLREARMDDEVRAVWEGVLRDLTEAGAAVRDVELPALPAAPAANGRVLGAEAAAVHGERLAADPDRFWPSVRTRLERGVELRAATVAADRHLGAQLRRQLRDAFAGVDVLVTPTLPCRVPPVDTDPIVVGGVEEAVTTAMTRLTNPWNLAGVPAGSVPADLDAGGAPVGIQVVGPWFSEATVLAAMSTVETVCGGPWPVARP